MHVVQWNLSNNINGAEGSVLISEVYVLMRLKEYCRTWDGKRCPSEVSSFQGVLIERFHCTLCVSVN